MTDEQKTALRIWNAEKLGWTGIHIGESYSLSKPEQYLVGTQKGFVLFVTSIPPLDLNTLAKVEKVVCKEFGFWFYLERWNNTKKPLTKLKWFDKDRFILCVINPDELTARIEALFAVKEWCEK